MSHSMSKPIPSGYALLTTSWENDGDNYGQHEIFGLSYEDAMMLYDVCQLFTRSVNNTPPKERKWGNIYQMNDVSRHDLAIELQAILKRHPDSELAQEELDGGDYFEDNMFDLLVQLYGNTEYATRVISSVTIIVVPDTIVFADVTNAVASHVSLLVQAANEPQT